MTGTDFFSRNAAAFAGSTSHAKGKDLELLLGRLGTVGGLETLDVATGTGFTAIALEKAGGMVTAVDPTSSMIREAQKLADSSGAERLELVMGTAENLPVLDSSVSVVTCRRAAHHFKDKAAFISEVDRVLVNGGRFGLVDMVAPAGHADEFNKLERQRDHSHVAAEEVATWYTLLSDAGLGVISCDVEEDELAFDKWLYPVERGSADGKKCVELLGNAEATFADSIGLKEDMSFTKRRMILIARKGVQGKSFSNRPAGNKKDNNHSVV